MLIVISTIASLLLAPVYAYMYSTFAGFYEILAGHLIKETTPAPLSVDQIEADAPPEKIEEVIEAVESKALEAAGSEEPEMLEEPEEIVDAEILPEPLEEEDKYND